MYGKRLMSMTTGWFITYITINTWISYFHYLVSNTQLSTDLPLFVGWGSLLCIFLQLQVRELETPNDSFSRSHRRKTTAKFTKRCNSRCRACLVTQHGGDPRFMLEGDQKSSGIKPWILSSVETTSSPWHSVHVAHIGMICHLKPVRSKCNDAAQDRSSIGQLDTRKENRID